MEKKKDNLSDAESKPVGYGSSMQSGGFANEMHGNSQLKPEAGSEKIKKVQSQSRPSKTKG